MASAVESAARSGGGWLYYAKLVLLVSGPALTAGGRTGRAAG